MSEEKKTLKPSGQEPFQVARDGEKAGMNVQKTDAQAAKSPDVKQYRANTEVDKKDGFVLNPKYKSVQEQARAYNEAQKAITKKSQELSQLKKQLVESQMLFKNLAQAGDGATAQKSGAVATLEAKSPVNSKLQALSANHKAQVKNIQNLYKSGEISLAQAVSLKEHLDKKMNDGKQQLSNHANSLQNEIMELRKNKAIEGFKTQKPEFFNSHERLEVIDYLKSATDDLTNQELESVAKLVEKVEQGAIERFKNSMAQTESIDSENEMAKVRLSSSVEGAGSNSVGERTFTKDEIKNMSNKEFRKNEKLIMAAMKQGKIKL